MLTCVKSPTEARLYIAFEVIDNTTIPFFHNVGVLPIDEVYSRDNAQGLSRQIHQTESTLTTKQLLEMLAVSARAS